MLKRFAIMVAATLALTCRAGDFTDLWWNPAQSGWGMNIVHQGDTSFITLFVYGPDGQPTWYSASDARAYAYSPGGLPYFAGTLHRTTGPWHGGTFDPREVRLVVVGSISIEPLAKDRLRVTYEVNGRSTTVELVRASLAIPETGYYYYGTLTLRESLPGQVPYGTARYNGDFTFEIEQGRATMRFTDASNRQCVYSGPYSQAGKFSSVAGSFTCGASPSAPTRSGSFTVTDMEFTSHGMTGMLRTTAADRNEAGRFAAERY